MARTSLNLPDDLWDEVRRVAEAQDRSITWTVRKALREFIDSCHQPVGGRDIHSPRGRPVDQEAGIRGAHPDKVIVDEVHQPRDVSPHFKGGQR